jgi:uncharacterized protein GlcG (DUF336 family)
MPGHFGKRIRVSQKTPGIVPKDERTVGFWDLSVIWGGFSIMRNFLLGALGVSGTGSDLTATFEATDQAPDCRPAKCYAHTDI